MAADPAPYATSQQRRDALQVQRLQRVLTWTGCIEVSLVGGTSIRQVVAITGRVRRYYGGGLPLPNKRNPVMPRSAKDVGKGGSALPPPCFDSTPV